MRYKKLHNVRRVLLNCDIFVALRSSSGFTVLELVVAMGIFITLMGIISGIFVGSIRSQRTLVELIAANDTANLALEQITREIRTGREFCIPASLPATLPGSCSGTLNQSNILAFQNANGATVVYRLENNVIERSENGGAIGTFFSLTGNRVFVEKLQFYIVSESFPARGYEWPPRITITTTIGSPSVNLQNMFTNIQTTVSGRNI